jgi:hypothetical protein
VLGVHSVCLWSLSSSGYFSFPNIDGVLPINIMTADSVVFLFTEECATWRQLYEDSVSCHTSGVVLAPLLLVQWQKSQAEGCCQSDHFLGPSDIPERIQCLRYSYMTNQLTKILHLNTMKYYQAIRLKLIRAKLTFQRLFSCLSPWSGTDVMRETELHTCVCVCLYIYVWGLRVGEREGVKSKKLTSLSLHHSWNC